MPAEGKEVLRLRIQCTLHPRFRSRPAHPDGVFSRFRAVHCVPCPECLRRVIVATAACVALGAVGGCASWAGFRPATQKPQPPSPHPASLPIKANDEPPPEVLTSVEEFLERTREYRHSATAPTQSTRARESHREEPPTPSSFALRNTAGSHEGAASVKPLTVANSQVFLSNPPTADALPAPPVVESVTVRVPQTPAARLESPSPVTRTTNESLEVRVNDDSTLGERFVGVLSKRAATTADFDAEWALRWTQLALQRDDEAADISPAFPKDQSGLFAALIRAAVAVRTLLRSTEADAGPTLTAVDELRKSLGERADPEVSAVALCRRVLTFGTYEELGAGELVAGRTNQAIVYCEIRNLRTETTAEGMFRTRLATRLELLSKEGRSVWQQEEPEIVDLCRRSRRDFFIAQRITLPANLTAGDYTLKVMVEDKLSQRVNEEIVSVNLVHAGSIAKAP